jgi:hypothetical protein
VAFAAIAMTACSDTSEVNVAAGPDPAATDRTPVTLPDIGGPGHTILIPGTGRSVVMQISDAKTVVTVTGPRDDADQPALPDGFEPSSGRTVNGMFYVLGVRCVAKSDKCDPELLRSSQSPIRWESVELPESLSSEDSLVDVGAIGTKYFVSPGGAKDPALYVLDDNSKSWLSIPPPPESGGSDVPICATHGQVFMFSAIPPGVTSETSGGQDDERLDYRVWTLITKTQKWTSFHPIGTWSRETETEFKSGGRSPVLCTAGTLLLNPDSSGTTGQLAVDDGKVTQSSIVLPHFSETADQPFPPAAIADDGLIVAGNPANRPKPWSASGATLVASGENGDQTQLLVRLKDGSAELWKIGFEA